jgi:hypothetical protein
MISICQAIANPASVMIDKTTETAFAVKEKHGPAHEDHCEAVT